MQGGKNTARLDPLAGAGLARTLTARCRAFLAPFLAALVRHRNRPQAPLLSELGTYLAGLRHAPAGSW